MDDSKTSMASTSSDDSGMSALSANLENIKQEKLDPQLPNVQGENVSQKGGMSSQQSKEKPRTKRTYNKKQKSLDSVSSIEKPPPKKRGRKSKKELQMMDNKSEFVPEFQPTPKKSKIKSPTQQKSQKTPKKTPTTKPRKSSGSSAGPSVFDKKILAGPHLTMKQVLEYILTDHSYCVPPDPLPAVGSNHQMIRYILGPKNGAKAKSLPNVTMIETSERSPVAYAGLSRARTQLSLSSTPPPSSKLENLLNRRGESSPLSLTGNSLRYSHSKHASDCRDGDDVDIDVESVDPEPEKRVAYDVSKAKEVMNECEKYVEFARGADTGDNWEAKIVRTGWTKAQSSLFDKVIGALHAERLARLTYAAAGDTEPVLRRASLDRTASRIRRIFGEYLWDTKLTQWLHSVLTEFLNFAYLAIYMDSLQTLKAQCPHLISRMMKLSIITPLQSAYGRDNELKDLLSPFLHEEPEVEETPTFVTEAMQTESDKDISTMSNEASLPLEDSSTKAEETEIYLPAKSVVPQVEDAMIQLHSAKNAEAFKTLLERQWDPFAPDLLQRLKRLSSNPIFLVISPGAIFSKSSLCARLKQFHRMFNRIGKIVKVHISNRETLDSTSVSGYLDKTFSAAREKIKEVRHYFPDRPLYLVGWGCGSILAARLSVTTGPVDGIIALGFPLHSLRDMHDDLLRIFGGIKHPILFVIGGLASNNSLTDMELFRKRLACETSLVVVGSGNENLFVSRDHREKLLITQSYVNKTVMDEVAYFVNLHSKHNQIIAANISMKPPQFSKSQPTSDALHARKSASLLRGKKRKSSFTDLDCEAFVAGSNANSKDSYDSDAEKSHESVPSNLHSIKREIDSMKKTPIGTFDYDFDGPKLIPSNKSSNKRKAYYRPDPTSTSSSITSSSCITASKLLQQSPNAKRRMSKPSGPTQRVPLLNQQPIQRNAAGQIMEKDDPAALYKYLNNEQEQSKASSTFPLVLRQNEGPYSGGNDRSAMGAPPYMGKDLTSDKTIKKKSSSKSKGTKTPKTGTAGSPTSSIISALNEVSPVSSIATSTPPSSLEMHKYVIQHQQMLKQNQERPHASQHSQLFKLLSPGTESENLNVTSLPAPAVPGVTQGPTDLVKLKLVGSQPGPPEVPGETRTAVISKQNLVSNMSLPMIRLSRPEETSQQKPLYLAGASSSGPTIPTNLLTDASEKILFRTNDKSLMKINAADIKNLIAGGRGIQLITGSGQGPLNIIVKKTPDSIESASSTPAISTSTGNDESAISTSPIAHEFPTPSLVIPTSDVLPSPSITEAITSTKEDEPLVEPQIEPEAMDVDTEEEMSGLLISSCFSVCPTSGERVLPSSSSPGTQISESGLETDSVKPLTDQPNQGGPSNEELLVVPIHVQSSSVLTEGESLISSNSEVEVAPPLAKDDEKSSVPLETSTTAIGAEEIGKRKSKKKTVKTDKASRCDSRAQEVDASSSVKVVSDDLLPVAVPILVKTQNTVVDGAKSDSSISPTNVVDAPITEVISTDVPSKEAELSKTTKLSPVPRASESITECTPEDENITQQALSSSPFSSDELLTVPIHIQSPCRIPDKESSSSSASKGTESNDSLPSTSDDGKGVTDSKTSEANPVEEKRKSKSNPVRRSARLKSGV